MLTNKHFLTASILAILGIFFCLNSSLSNLETYSLQWLRCIICILFNSAIALIIATYFGWCAALEKFNRYFIYGTYTFVFIASFTSSHNPDSLYRLFIECVFAVSGIFFGKVLAIKFPSKNDNDDCL